jgi:hypothetical protein
MNLGALHERRFFWLRPNNFMHDIRTISAWSNIWFWAMPLVKTQNNISSIRLFAPCMIAAIDRMKPCTVRCTQLQVLGVTADQCLLLKYSMTAHVHLYERSEGLYERQGCLSARGMFCSTLKSQLFRF